MTEDAFRTDLPNLLIQISGRINPLGLILSFSWLCFNWSSRTAHPLGIGFFCSIKFQGWLFFDIFLFFQTLQIIFKRWREVSSVRDSFKSDNLLESLSKLPEQHLIRFLRTPLNFLCHIQFSLFTSQRSLQFCLFARNIKSRHLCQFLPCRSFQIRQLFHSLCNLLHKLN